MINTKLNIESIIDGSIEKDKLAESVQESLNKADTAVQTISYKKTPTTTILTTLSKNEDKNITIPVATTSICGLAMLSDSVSSDSSKYAATSYAVKQSYDLANSKYTKPEDGISYEDLHEDIQENISRASSAIIPSDLYYEVVSFTIDDLDDAYINNRGYIDIGHADYSCFRPHKRVVIKENENSDVVYPLTFTKQGAGISGSYSGRVSFNAKGISYEFDISTNMVNLIGSISNINKRANTYIADFTLYDIDSIDYGYDFTFDIRSLYNAIINKQTIIVRNDVDSAGISKLNYIDVLYVNAEYDKIECHIPSKSGYYILSELMYNKTEQGSQTYTVTSSNVKFHYYDPYIMDITIEDLEYLLSGQAQSIPFNSNALRNAFDINRPVIIKNKFGGNFVVSGYQEDLLYFSVLTDGLIYMVDVGYNVNTIDSSSISIQKFNLTDIKLTYPVIPFSTYISRAVISPNKFYKFGTPESPLSGTINITLGAEISGVVNEYIFEIYTSAEVVPTLDLPDDIKWVSGDAPVLEENKIYQISIINKLGTVLSWDNA